MPKFEKISLEQCYKDGIDFSEWEALKLPEHGTKFSAGSDFFAIRDINIPPNGKVKFPSGIRCIMSEDEVMLIFVRSSIGTKFDIVLSNGTGVIDSDYAEADNEGHIWFVLRNEGELPFRLDKGKAFAQGIVFKFESLNTGVKVRSGGFGSTDCGQK